MLYTLVVKRELVKRKGKMPLVAESLRHFELKKKTLTFRYSPNQVDTSVSWCSPGRTSQEQNSSFDCVTLSPSSNQSARALRLYVSFHQKYFISVLPPWPGLLHWNFRVDTKKKKKIIPEVHIYDQTGDDEPRIWILSPGEVRWCRATDHLLLYLKIVINGFVLLWSGEFFLPGKLMRPWWSQHLLRGKRVPGEKVCLHL